MKLHFFNKQILFYIFTISLSLFSAMNADTIIFRVDENGIALPALPYMTNSYKRAHELRLKYQFPMSTNPSNNLTDEEKAEIWSNEPAAEEKFLRRKIQEEYDDPLCQDQKVACI